MSEEQLTRTVEESYVVTRCDLCGGAILETRHDTLFSRSGLPGGIFKVYGTESWRIPVLREYIICKDCVPKIVEFIES